MILLAGGIGARVILGRQGAEALYVFQPHPHGASTVAVNARFQRLAVDSLLLDMNLQDEAAHLSVDGASQDGVPLLFRLVQTEKTVAARAFTFQRACISLGEGSSADVRYHVDVGRTEGDAHTHGFTGSVYGRSTPEYLITSYAQLLLLPSPISTFHDVRFRYDLPAGWSTVTPLNARSLPSSFGQGTVNDYCFAPIAMGKLAVRTFDDLALRVAVAGATPEEALTLAARVGDVYRSAAGLLGATPTDPYLVILAPPDERGFSTFVEPTYFGQTVTYAGGRILQAETATRRMVERVAHATGADRPFNHPGERWFLPSLYTWASSRARAPSPRDEKLGSNWNDAYARLIYEGGDRPLAESEESEAVTKGTAVLGILDATIRNASAGADSLSRVLTLLARRAPGIRLRSFLEEAFSLDLEAFFRDYVDGTTPLPVPALPHPQRPAVHGATTVAARDSIALVVVYNGHGYLETCGCKANMWGGMARVATWSKEFKRRFAGSVFMISAGNTFPTNVTTPLLDRFSEQELELYLTLLGQCGFDAASVGQSELYYGSSELAAVATQSPVRFVSANLEAGAIPAVAEFQLIRRGNVKMGVSGLVAPEEHPLYAALWESRATALRRTAPLPAVKRVAHKMRREGADLVVIAGRLKPSLIRALAAASEQPLILVSYDPICKCTGDYGQLFIHDRSGFLGDDLVLYPGADRYGVSAYVLYRDPSGAIVDFAEKDVYMTEKIADDPATRRQIDAFYMAVGPTVDVSAIVRTEPWAKVTTGGSRFVGADACEECHHEQYAQWIDTPHGAAFKTLLKQHRQYNPSCVSCHVTGFELESGYRFGDMTSSMANVQCESCHGPGADHVSSGAKSPLPGKPEEAVCRSCHTDDHSDMTETNFSKYYAAVTH